MNAITLSFNAVFPLLAYMVLGFALRRVGLLSEQTAAGLNKLVFKVFLPLSIFQNICAADIRSKFDVKLAVYVAVTCILSYIIISLAVNARVKEKTVAPVIIQGMHKSNYNLLAIPIVTSFFGSEIGMTAVLMVVITPLVNICSTLAFESARGGKAGFLPLLKKLILNPLILSSLLGLIVNLLGIKIPALILNNVIGKLGAMATPVAMLALGSGFDFRSMKKWKMQLLAVSVVKLIVLPLIIVAGAIPLGIRGANLIAVLVYSGSHAAVNSYSTAVSMGGNEELAGEIVALTSLLCVFTLFVFLTILSTLGFI